jgi:hypothetical protein
MKNWRLILTSIAVLVLGARPAAAQAAYPPISARQFTGGTVKIVVTGSFSDSAEFVPDENNCTIRRQHRLQFHGAFTLGSADRYWPYSSRAS